jgi:hypothetical protein
MTHYMEKVSRAVVADNVAQLGQEWRCGFDDEGGISKKY